MTRLKSFRRGFLEKEEGFLRVKREGADEFFSKGQRQFSQVMVMLDDVGCAFYCSLSGVVRSLNGFLPVPFVLLVDFLGFPSIVVTLLWLSS